MTYAYAASEAYRNKCELGVNFAVAAAASVIDNTEYSVSCALGVNFAVAASDTWTEATPSLYSGNAPYNSLRKSGSATDEASKAAAVTAGHGAATTATAWFDGMAGMSIQHREDPASNYDVPLLLIMRTWWQVAIPAGMTEAQVRIATYVNSYWTGAGPTLGVCPTSNILFYISTTSPGTIAAGDWTYGSLGATIALPNYTSNGAEGATASAWTNLANFTANATNYIQGIGLETEPSFVASTAYWPESASSATMSRYMTAMNVRYH